MDDTFVDRLDRYGARHIQRVLDTDVSARIAAYLGEARTGSEMPLVIRYAAEGVQVQGAQGEDS